MSFFTKLFVFFLMALTFAGCRSSDSNNGLPPLSLVSLTPANQAFGVSADSKVKAVFNQWLTDSEAPQTLTVGQLKGTFKLINQRTHAVVDGSVTVLKETVEFTPSQLLDRNTEYLIVVKSERDPSTGIVGAIENAIFDSVFAVLEKAFDFKNFPVTFTSSFTTAPILSIEIAPAAVSTPVGFSVALTATGICADGTKVVLGADHGLVWLADNLNVATVNPQGILIGMSKGSTSVRARIFGKEASSAVSVTDATLKSVAIHPGSLTLPRGAQGAFTVKGFFSDGSTQDVSSSATWTTTDLAGGPFVTTVTGGTVTADATGIAKVEATVGPYTADAILTVVDASLTNIEVTVDSGMVAAGLGFKARAIGTYTDGSNVDLTTLVNWSSSDLCLASVGALSFAGQGFDTYTAGTVNVKASFLGKEGSISVEIVAPNLTGLRVESPTAQLAIGEATQLRAYAAYTNGEVEVTGITTWSSANAEVIEVSNGYGTTGVATGLVFSLNPVTISASFETLNASVDLTVGTPALLSFRIQPQEKRTSFGKKVQYTAFAEYASNPGVEVDVTAATTWSSSSNEVATIDANGLATANYHIAGETMISGSSGGLSDTTTLTVFPSDVHSLKLSPHDSCINVGEVMDYRAIADLHNGVQDLDVSAYITGRSIIGNKIAEALSPSGTGIAVIGISTGLSTLNVTYGGKLAVRIIEVRNGTCP